MRPRVLYFAVFVFFSSSGGRFAATFLEHELQLKDNWMISTAFALQLLTSSLTGSYFGGLADSWDASSSKGKNIGRLQLMSYGLLFSTAAILLHSLGGLYPKNDDNESLPIPLLAYHLILRILYSLGTKAISPALDGLTLVQLEEEGVDKQNYGKERLYGAISWGITHIIIGFIIDIFDSYKAIYFTTLMSCIGCIVTFIVYAKSISSIKYDVVSTASNTDTSDNDIASETTKQKRKKYKSKTSFEVSEAEFENDTATDNNSDTIERLSFKDLILILFQKSPIINISFIVALFSLFIGMSVVEQLIFLYFEFLGGSAVMFGITVVVTVLFEIPLFFFAPNVLNYFGVQCTFQFACLAYVIRVIGYSFIPQSHPYLVLFLEPLHGVTIAFSNTASVDFADSIVPKGYESSGQGFMSMIRSTGMLSGIFIAGFLEGRTLYRVLAAIVTVGSIILGIGNYISTSPGRQHQVIREEDNDTPAIQQQRQEDDKGTHIVEMI